MSINIFSVSGLIAWLETQDPETEYNWADCRDCLGLRYLKARGVSEPERAYVALSKVAAGNDDMGLTISIKRPWTYGAALARAKELVTS